MKLKRVLLAVLTLIFFISFNTDIVLAKTKVTSTKRPPSAPLGMTVSGYNSTEVSLKWNVVSGAKGYRIYRATNYDSRYVLIATSSSTSYKNIKLIPGTTYWYYVKAYNSYGYSGDSAHVKVTIPRPVPASPTGLVSAGFTEKEINIKWNAVSGATSYKIFRASPSDTNYKEIATISGTAFKNIGLTPDTSYWYYVKAYNSYGASGDSAHIRIITAKAQPEPLPLPVNIPVQTKMVLGYTTYYYSGDSSSYNSIANNYSLIDEIATHTYSSDSLGNISGLDPTNQLSLANSKGIKTLASVTNNFDGDIARSILENPVNRSNLITNILNELKINGYKGVNIDFEGIYYYDRSCFVDFMRELYTALKAQGYIVTTAVPAKTIDSITNSWSGGYDYAKIAQYSDQVIIMTYDEHWLGGEAGPVASLGWVQQVLNYALTVIPKDKILLGIAAYGYDWSAAGNKAYSIPQINNIINAYKADVQWDAASQTPYVKYTDISGIAHTLWFENSTSISYKLDLINNANTSGIAIWRLGLEDSSFLTTIKNKFNK